LRNGLLLVALVFATSTHATCFHFTQEHVDLLSIQWNAASNTLSLVASDDDHGGRLYASNECVVVCPESMKFTLPGGTPLGDEGDVLWILPQNPYAGVPYVGVSAEDVPGGVFNDPLTVRLTRLEGPGHFVVWQTVGFGQFNVKLDTRDSIGANDTLTIPVGGHAHYNWGFTTSGVYRAYFQALGGRMGQSTNTVSPETPFTFHVLPLRPFELWTATNWPCECATNIIAAVADPDGDQAVNALEYGTGTDPKQFTTNPWSEFSFVTANGQTYGALTFNRAKAATDATCEVVATGSLTAPGWQGLTNLHGVVDQGATERLTMRDNAPIGSATNRFYQLRVWLP
jgi:surface-anchored protein